MSYAGTADLAKLVSNLTSASRNAPQMTDEIMDKAAEKIRNRMIELAPKKTGHLANSIQIIKSKNSWVIGPVEVKYAVYQEFGTATRGEFGGPSYIIKPVHAEMLAFQIKGKWVFTKKVVHPGIPPHPYARPALAEYVNSLPKDLAQAAAMQVAGKSVAA